jgi:hypothetical protein
MPIDFKIPLAPHQERNEQNNGSTPRILLSFIAQHANL